MLTSLTKR